MDAQAALLSGIAHFRFYQRGVKNVPAERMWYIMWLMVKRGNQE